MDVAKAIGRCYRNWRTNHNEFITSSSDAFSQEHLCVEVDSSSSSSRICGVVVVQLCRSDTTISCISPQVTQQRYLVDIRSRTIRIIMIIVLAEFETEIGRTTETVNSSFRFE